jgi:hypothetical protein
MLNSKPVLPINLAHGSHQPDVPKHHKSTKLPLPAPITMAVAHTNHQAPSIINQICNLKEEKQTRAQPLYLQIINQSLTAKQFCNSKTISNYPSPITISNLPLHRKEPNLKSQPVPLHSHSTINFQSCNQKKAAQNFLMQSSRKLLLPFNCSAAVDFKVVAHLNPIDDDTANIDPLFCPPIKLQTEQKIKKEWIKPSPLLPHNSTAGIIPICPCPRSRRRRSLRIKSPLPSAAINKKKTKAEDTSREEELEKKS